MNKQWFSTGEVLPDPSPLSRDTIGLQLRPEIARVRVVEDDLPAIVREESGARRDPVGGALEEGPVRSPLYWKVMPTGWRFGFPFSYSWMKRIMWDCHSVEAGWFSFEIS